MTTYQPRGRPPCIHVHEYDLALFVGQAVAKYPFETPASGFGLRTQRGDLVVQLGFPAGHGAVEMTSYCQHSLDYFRRMASFSKDRYDLDFISEIHSHGAHKLPSPSLGDLTNYSSLARRNHIDVLGQFIISFIEPDDSPLLDSSAHFCPVHRRTLPSEADIVDNQDILPLAHHRPVVSPFALIRTETGEYEYQECKLLLLPGKGPLRIHLEQTGADRHNGFAFTNPPYPLRDVVIHRLIDSGEKNPFSPPPHVLLEECGELPLEVVDGTEIYDAERCWIVRIPISPHRHFLLVYRDSNEPTPELSGVYLRERNDGITDISQRVSSTRLGCSILQIYQSALELLNDDVKALREQLTEEFPGFPEVDSENTLPSRGGRPPNAMNGKPNQEQQGDAQS